MDQALQATIAAGASFVFVSLLFLLLFLICSPKPPPLPCPHPPPSTSASFDPNLHISMEVLKRACRNFSPDLVVGDGSFGLVYRAALPDGSVVAVKKLHEDAFHGLREFAAEMETLGRIKHPNLAKILGYSICGRERVLVYEFLEKGSLDGWLHEEEKGVLGWRTRVGIVKGTAEGLAFLHDGCKPSIIHRDIKSSNVLLDADFEAHIADFGLARQVDASRSHVSTQAAGTMGYMPPEYRDGLMVATVKADVYSFGVLMLEIATGKRPNLPVRVKDGNVKEVALVRWAKKMVEEKRWLEMLDPQMGDSEVPREEIIGYLTVALRCTVEVPNERPIMAEIVAMLTEL